MVVKGRIFILLAHFTVLLSMTDVVVHSFNLPNLMKNSDNVFPTRSSRQAADSPISEEILFVPDNKKADSVVTGEGDDVGDRSASPGHAPIAAGSSDSNTQNQSDEENSNDGDLFVDPTDQMFDEKSKSEGGGDDIDDNIVPTENERLLAISEAIEASTFVQRVLSALLDIPCRLDDNPDAADSLKRSEKKLSSCDTTNFPTCTCTNPPKFTEDGRGNCNLGATKPDRQVWCYVNKELGDPEEMCPDAKTSSTLDGEYWSRFACITD